MVVGATELCHTILESCYRAKQPWQRRFFNFVAGAQFLGYKGGDPKGGKTFFENLSILYKMYQSQNYILREIYFWYFDLRPPSGYLGVGLLVLFHVSENFG